MVWPLQEWLVEVVDLFDNDGTRCKTWFGPKICRVVTGNMFCCDMCHRHSWPSGWTVESATGVLANVDVAVDGDVSVVTMVTSVRSHLEPFKPSPFTRLATVLTGHLCLQPSWDAREVKLRLWRQNSNLSGILIGFAQNGKVEVWSLDTWLGLEVWSWRDQDLEHLKGRQQELYQNPLENPLEHLFPWLTKLDPSSNETIPLQILRTQSSTLLETPAIGDKGPVETAQDPWQKIVGWKKLSKVLMGWASSRLLPDVASKTGPSWFSNFQRFHGTSADFAELLGAREILHKKSQDVNTENIDQQIEQSAAFNGIYCHTCTKPIRSNLFTGATSAGWSERGGLGRVSEVGCLPFVILGCLYNPLVHGTVLEMKTSIVSRKRKWTCGHRAIESLCFCMAGIAPQLSHSHQEPPKPATEKVRSTRGSRKVFGPSFMPVSYTWEQNLEKASNRYQLNAHMIWFDFIEYEMR